MKDSKTYRTYVEILKKELKPAMGCTEPIALAFCAAVARETLGEDPKEIIVNASGNIIKNVKSVVVPNTCGLHGIEAAVIVGSFFGKADKKLEVIADVTLDESSKLSDLLKQVKVTVMPLESDHILDMIVTVKGEKDSATARIWDSHTNLVLLQKNSEVIIDHTADNPVAADDVQEAEEQLDYDLLKVKDIFEFANQADLEDVQDVLWEQIRCNGAIAEEGINKAFGAQIGKTILLQGDAPRIRAKAYAAAASDARMGGCELPVIINSGSGNQGITCSVPVIQYAKCYEKSEEELLRALLVSNLITLHLKSGIGRLSAYCGAVSAGVGAGAGIAYLLTKNLKVIEHTIVNAIVITSGIVCDGAKASCAAKIAMSVEAGILGFEMYQQGNQFLAGDGLVEKGVENTIYNISTLGHEGMKETDKTIIGIMTECI